MENAKKVTTSNQRIRELIDQLHVSQIDFCSTTGLKPSALSNYLNDNRTPRQDAISKIAEAYYVNPSWLMGYDVQQRIDSPSMIVSPDGGGFFQIIAPESRYNEYRRLIQAADLCNIEQIVLAIEILEQFSKLNYLDD